MFGSEEDLILWPRRLPRELKRRIATSRSALDIKKKELYYLNSQTINCLL